MPKSKNRKDHKKKVKARNSRLKAQNNAFNKKIKEMFAKKEMSFNNVTTDPVNNNENLETNN
jgi:hypothetical protein